MYLVLKICAGFGERSSKANKQARLVEREICFILDACDGRGGGGMADICSKADSPTPLQPRPHSTNALATSRTRAFIDRSEGATCRKTAQSANSYLVRLVV